MSGPEDQILTIYAAQAAGWTRRRSQGLMERGWLDRFLAAMPSGRQVLDLGCGTGQPMATWLAAQGCRITGVDGVAGMLAEARAVLPDHRWIEADLRDLPDLGRFDGILLWHSSFHLTPEAQRQLFAGLGARANLGAALMFTSGPAAGVAMGEMGGAPLYHASLDAAEYRAILAAAGFAVLQHVETDPDCGGASVWLARQG